MGRRPRRSVLAVGVLATSLTLWGTGHLPAADAAPVDGTADPAPATFSSAIASPAGQPTSLAAADLNGDGHQDLVVTHATGGISVLLGDSTGFFPSAIGYPVGGTLGSVVVDDLDADQVPDVAVTDSVGNAVSVLLGSGDGSLVARSTTPVGSGPSSLATGDLNGDTIPDIVTSNAGSDDVSALLGRGDGTFAQQGTAAVGAAPSGDDVADFDGDGKLDAVTSDAGSDTVSILHGGGDGTFASPAASHPAGTSPSSVTAGDVNDDGVPDVVVTAAGSDQVAVLLGDGDGGFGSTTFAPTATPSGAGGQPLAVAEADYDGDGQVDLAVANGVGTLSLLLGDGTGGFTPSSSLDTLTPASWLVSADIDGDERPDLALSTTGGVEVFLNTTAFPLSRPTTSAPAGGACRHQATLRGELRATAYATRWRFEWWTRQGHGHHTEDVLVPPDDDPRAVAVTLRHLRTGSTVRYRLVALSHGARVEGLIQRLHVEPRCR